MTVKSIVLIAGLLQAPGQASPVQRVPDSVVVVGVPADPDNHSLAVWTKWLGIATLVLAAASVGSLQVLRGQGSDLKAQHVTLQETSSHLAAQAEHLKAAVDASRLHATTELRAYVGVKIVSASGPMEWTDHMPRIWVEIANTGKTPATDVTTAFEGHILTATKSARDRFPVPVGDVASRGVLGTVDPTQVEIVCASVAEEHREQFGRSAKFSVYICGTVRYRDVFHNDRLTNFCRRVNWDPKGTTITTPDYGNDFT